MSLSNEFRIKQLSNLINISFSPDKVSKKVLYGTINAKNIDEQIRLLDFLIEDYSNKLFEGNYKFIYSLKWIEKVSEPTKGFLFSNHPEILEHKNFIHEDLPNALIQDEILENFKNRLSRYADITLLLGLNSSNHNLFNEALENELIIYSNLAKTCIIKGWQDPLKNSLKAIGYISNALCVLKKPISKHGYFMPIINEDHENQFKESIESIFKISERA